MATTATGVRETAFDVVQLPATGELAALWLTSDKDPPAEDWAAAMALLSTTSQKTGVPLGAFKHLVITDAGAPSAKQRAELSKMAPGKVAVVTPALSNPLKRGIATAVTWLNPQVVFFKPEEFMGALDHIGVGRHRLAVWTCYRDLAKSAPPNSTLKSIARRFDLAWP